MRSRSVADYDGAPCRIDDTPWCLRSMVLLSEG